MSWYADYMNWLPLGGAVDNNIILIYTIVRFSDNIHLYQILFTYMMDFMIKSVVWW